MSKRMNTAVAAVERLEAVALGETWAAAASEASGAVDELAAAADAELFPTLPQPVGADLAADFDVYTRGLPRLGFHRALAAKHSDCVGSHPSLAAVMRGPVGLAKIREFASGNAAALGSEESDAIAEAIEEFRHEVARQLAGHGELLPWSQIRGVDVPGLRAQIAAARERHQDNADNELARLEQERLEADRVIGEQHEEAQREVEAEAAELERAAQRARYQAEKQRADELADRLERSGENELRVGSGRFRVAELVGALRAGDCSPERTRAIEAAIDRQVAA